MTPIDNKPIPEIKKEGKCPQCGMTLRPDGGCMYCPCGCWSSCG